MSEAIAYEQPEGEIEPMQRLRRDLRKSAETMGREEARWLVDMYYTVQNWRIRAGNQARAASESEEPHALVGWGLHTFETVEKSIASALGVYARSKTVGAWALSIHGIGPVCAAGLLAHIDIRKAPTAGAIWRYAGLDPSVKWHGTDDAGALVRAAFDAEDTPGKAMAWLSRATNRHVSQLYAVSAPEQMENVLDEARAIELFGEDLWAEARRERPLHVDNSVEFACKRFGVNADSVWDELYPDGAIDRAKLRKFLAKRPWNTPLKRLCWIIGGSFVKFRGSKKDVYGRFYDQRKALEIERNESGAFAQVAAETLQAKRISEPGTRARYDAGQLPDGRIHLRAQRFAVKLFLSHYHHVAWEAEFGEPPRNPYSVEFLDGHEEHIGPPNWPMQ